MNFTFAMITATQNNPNEDATLIEVSNRIWKIFQSIINENIPNYEIILIGGEIPTWFEEELNKQNVDFSHYQPEKEVEENNLIGMKKNHFAHLAKYENIVYMHDYVCLDPGWYKGMLRFGNGFHILMNKIYDSDGKRAYDWFINVDPHLGNKVHPKLQYLYDNRATFENTPTLLPYDVDWMYHHQFMPGQYWIAKKDVMLFVPIHPELQWGQAEDIEWSFRARDKFKMEMNPHSSVRFIKPGKTHPRPLVELSEEDMKAVYEMKETGWDNRRWAKDFWDKAEAAGAWTEEHENYFTSWKHSGAKP